MIKVMQGIHPLVTELQSPYSFLSKGRCFSGKTQSHPPPHLRGEQVSTDFYPPTPDSLLGKEPAVRDPCLAISLMPLAHHDVVFSPNR